MAIKVPSKKSVEKEAGSNVSASNLRTILTKVINSKFKEAVAYELGKASPTDVREWISTGSTLLDYICSNKRDGGIPIGKIVEIIGQESSGKSLLCQHIAANVQKKGGFVAYIDTESAIDAKFMERIGVNIDSMLYAQPGTMENVLETMEEIVKRVRESNDDIPVALIWDSVAGTPTKAEIEGTFDPKESIAEAAKIISKAMRKLTKEIGESRIIAVFTNQLKTSIGVKFGDPMSATYGGKAIPFHSSLRIKLAKRGLVKKLEDVIGIGCEAKIIKSRVAPPFRTCNFNILFNEGIDDSGSIMEYFKDIKKIETKGSWYHMGDKKFAGQKGWNELWADESFRKQCLDDLEEAMVIKYTASDEEKMKQIDINPESDLEMKALAAEIDEQEESAERKLDGSEQMAKGGH